jgi:hypothetical protein
MPGTLTLTGQGRALDWMFTVSAPTRPTTWFAAMHVGANGGAGGSNEIVGNGYARQAVSWSRSGNVVSNTAVLTFGPDTSVNWGNVTDVTIWDSLTSGTCLAQGTATAAVTYAAGDTATIAANALSISLT